MSAPSIAGYLSLNATEGSPGLPLRNLFITLTLTSLALAAAGVYWGPNGYNALVVALGWPHLLLAFFFGMGRIFRRDGRTIVFSCLLGLATVLIATLYFYYAITDLIAFYFLFHITRDEVFIFEQTSTRRFKGIGDSNLAGTIFLSLLLLMVPYGLRRVDVSGFSTETPQWKLVTFPAVRHSSGRQYYFYLTATGPRRSNNLSVGMETVFTTPRGQQWADGVKAEDGSQMAFVPQYNSDPRLPSGEISPSSISRIEKLEVGHQIGQTFTADRDELTGIWVNVGAKDFAESSGHVHFNLTSRALRVLPPLDMRLHQILIAFLLLFLVARMLQRFHPSLNLWMYLAILSASIFGIYKLLNGLFEAGVPVPSPLPFVIVAHYFSWYVFYLSKLNAQASRPSTALQSATGFSMTMPAFFQRKTPFLTLVVLLNFTFIGLTYAFSRLDSLSFLRYELDYNYFLYPIIFHVTFSFHLPEKLRWKAWRRESFA
jgi:hypothetical protein